MTLNQKLARIDLNLLVSLDVLLKEKNVSKAADLLFISQSAMSRTLDRLRQLFDDKLLFRSGKVMDITVLGKDLSLALPPILLQIEQVFESNSFDPKTSTRSFTLSVPSLLTHYFSLQLMKQLSVIAPHIQISILPAYVDIEKKLVRGNVDFAIHINKLEDINFKCSVLSKIEGTIYAHNSHPILRKKNITIADCLEYNFVDLILDDDTESKLMDTLLANIDNKIKRNVIYRSTQLYLLTEMMKHSQSLMLGSQLVQKDEKETAAFVPIFHIKNTTTTSQLVLIEHARTEDSSAHQWMSTQIKMLFT